MINFFTKIFSRTTEPSIPKEPPHIHSFELIAKTVAEPSNILPKSPDGFVMPSAVLGCTSYLWECTECGELRSQFLLGSEESGLVSILRKVDEQGAVGILRDGKRYVVGPVEESRPAGTLPVR